MLPSMPVLFPRDSQSGDGLLFTPPPLAVSFLEPAPKEPLKQETVLKTDNDKKEDAAQDTPAESDHDKHEAHFVTSYYNKVRSKLGVEKFNRFQEVLRTFEPARESPVVLYQRLEEVFGDEDMLEEFLVFLTPGQAAAVGRFMDHLMLTSVMKFLQYLQVTLSRKPAKLRKVTRALSTAVSDARGVGELRARVEPLLKASPRLLHTFRALFPDQRPPDSVYTPHHTEEFPESAWATDTGQQRLELEETAQRPRQGPHVTYLRGRVFIQQGRVLRPATITFPQGSIEEHTKRLAPVPDPNLQPQVSLDEERKNVKSSERPLKTGGRNVKSKKDKNVSPERAGKNASEVGKKTIKVTVDAQIEKMVAKRVQDVNSLSLRVNPNGVAVEGSQVHVECKEEVKSKRKREASPEPRMKTDAEESKRPGRKNAKRLDTKKTENGERVKPVIKLKTVFDKSKAKAKITEKSVTCEREADTRKEKKEDDQNKVTEENVKKVNCDWTREEDKSILLVLKKGTDSEETLTKMKEMLPHRSLTELRERFYHVMDLLRKMALGEVT